MFESALVPIPADAPKTLPVQKGEEPTLELCYTAPERCLAVKGQGSALQAEVELPRTLEAPIREGSVIGSLNIKNSQGILQSCPIIAAKPLTRAVLAVVSGVLSMLYGLQRKVLCKTDEKRQVLA